MTRPVTPFVGVDVFIHDEESRVLLIRRTDNGFWGTPGGYQDLGETPKECGVREVLEETGFKVKITRLLGLFSSLKYEFVNYPWKDREITHFFFLGEIVGGKAKLSGETSEMGWFAHNELPPLSDGHAPRIDFAFEYFENPNLSPHFE